ncbi:MAG: helix-turn-helix transcriptional regulator [Chlorobia bacterium]|nr:helix-turn-helix transcriptional regulator [Fimbriimonadaceae bacterium]
MGNKKPVASLNTREYDDLLLVLKEARKEKRVSQEKLSALLGQSVNFVLKIEQKERRIDVVEFSQLARALEIDPEELFKRYLRRVG